MISAETAIRTTNQFLEDYFERCVLLECESRKNFIYINEENMPLWLQEKVISQGFTIKRAGNSYRISWENLNG